MRANEKRSFRTVICTGKNMESEESIFEVIEACRRVVCSECNVNVDQEFNMSEEASSFHVLGYG